MSDVKNPLDSDLDRLLSAYRDACGDCEISPNFMPRLWDRIESRRDALQPFVRRLTQFFAGLAAAASFALLALTLIPQESSPLSYVEVLAQNHASEKVLYQDVILSDSDGDGEPDTPPAAQSPK